MLTCCSYREYREDDKNSKKCVSCFNIEYCIFTLSLKNLRCLFFKSFAAKMATPRPVRPAEPEKNWEDEYKRLREENIALKQLCNEQEDHIRRYKCHLMYIFQLKTFTKMVLNIL